jgi:RHS repeat-associated protein
LDFTTRVHTACRPWGILDRTYDKIGNRTTEGRNGGAPDTDQYLVNGAGGNTPILDLINLAVTGTRDYTWGAAGHLEEVAAGANVLDFGADAEGRLSGVDRTAASEAAGFSYDGRSFLQTAQETAGGTRSVDPLYDSAGLVHALRRHPSPTDPEELVVFVYLAGRPVAQLAIDGAGAESWTYLSTDHLGTPLLATADTGSVVWEGGFEPFGNDYQAGTPAGALESQVYLRLPGQWQDTSWQDASSGAGIYYNVHRWAQPARGSYTRPDPAGILPPERGAANLYLYGLGNPVNFFDLVGLDALTNDLGIQDCMFCIFWQAGQGLRDIEEGMWVTCSGGKYHCEIWPSTNRPGNSRKVTTSSSPRPQDACAIVHTHPRARPPKPSTCKQPNCDVIVSRRLNLPIYTVHPSGVWKYDPSTGMTTQELAAGWYRDPKKRCKKPCQGLP